jgi:hypothetical protein
MVQDVQGHQLGQGHAGLVDQSQGFVGKTTMDQAHHLAKEASKHF